MEYEKFLNKIVISSGLKREEIEKRIEAKREKLSGLISKEGAAQVIAAELGINFENEKLKINELSSGMRKVNLVGKVIGLFPVRTFVRNGQEGKVANMIIADETSNIRAVLWDESHINLIKKGEISEGSVVEISNASMKGSELHLGSFSELKASNEILDKIQTEKTFIEKNISNVELAENVVIRAFIVQSFEPRFFNVCPECKKKIIQEADGFFCQEHKKIIPEKRAVISMVLDDGTNIIRAVLFNELLESLLGKEFQNDIENKNFQKENFLGKEMLFRGNIRVNKFFNEPEIIVEKIEELNLDELIAKLEKND